jgi:hypothetical protein
MDITALVCGTIDGPLIKLILLFIRVHRRVIAVYVPISGAFVFTVVAFSTMILITAQNIFLN